MGFGPLVDNMLIIEPYSHLCSCASATSLLNQTAPLIIFRYVGIQATRHLCFDLSQHDGVFWEEYRVVSGMTLVKLLSHFFC